MKQLLKAACILLLLSIPLVGWTENSRTSEGVKEICENFLEQITEGNYNGAFSYIKEFPNSIGAQEFSELEISTIQQSPTIKNLYGRVLGMRLVKEEYASDFGMTLVYVLLREHLPIRWKFVYYKPERDWKLVAILFDDLMDELF